MKLYLYPAEPASSVVGETTLRNCFSLTCLPNGRSFQGSKGQV